MLLSSIITLILGKAAMSSLVWFLVVQYIASRRGPDIVFRDEGLYAGFKAYRNFLAKELSNILKG